jgi:hypothetical protein
MSTLTSMKVEQWPIDKPIPYSRNPRKISQAAVDKVAASIQEFGWRQPIVVDKDRVIIVGHTRLAAAKKLELKTVPVHVALDLTPAQVRAYRLADNRTNEEAAWDDELLALELVDLKAEDYDLAFTAFDIAELTELLADDADPDAGAAGCSDGSLLKQLNITIADPKNSVETRDIWNLGNHVLVCDSVVAGWPTWSKFLDRPSALFCPFPGPFVLLSRKAADFRLILVQPDPYIAGHIVDRYVEIHGDEAVTKVET